MIMIFNSLKVRLLNRKWFNKAGQFHLPTSQNRAHIINFSALLFALLIILSLGACASVPYQYTLNPESENALQLGINEEQIEKGRPNGFLDNTGHYLFSLPTKLMLLNWQVCNHNISPATEKALQQYLATNNLNNVKVRLNQYAPGAEWSRLIRNRDMPGFFKYTAGVVATTIYTIFPDRLFCGIIGGDHYNPYTNTINLYSDNIPIAIHEGGHAKDFVPRNRHLKGWYALMRILPLMPLYQEGRASSDAISYMIAEDMLEERQDAYKILYPAYMTYVASEGIRWIPMEYWLSYSIQFAVTIPGHISGRIEAAVSENPPPTRKNP